MGEPFIGQIFTVGFNFAPVGYALCNGQLLSIADNNVLFLLIGTIYGGDGVSTFALPNLQGRVPIHQGSGAGLNPYIIGQSGGEENHTLLNNEMPPHSHGLAAVNGAGTTNLPASAYLAQGPSTGSGPNATALDTYTANSAPLATLNAASVQTAGTDMPHSNLEPYLCVNYVISLQGIFPSQN